MEQSDETEPALSKSQLKKQIKHEKWILGRDDRRSFEREKRKLQRRQRAKERAARGEPNPRYTLMSESTNKVKVIIDLDFNEFMTAKELAKSAQQVGRIYAANRHSTRPFQLYLTSLTGKIRDQFEVTNKGFLNWDIYHSSDDYLDLFDTLSFGDETSKSRFIYLTADTEECLPDVDTLVRDYSSKVFVIGGLVDHNRHKNLCFNRAEERGVTTAKLPITQHIKLSQRQILSTVTVFEILLKVFESGKQWPEVLSQCIPKRKIASSSHKILEDGQKT